MRALADLERITRLGRGVDATGRLAEEAIDRTVAALAEAAAAARALGVARIAAVGTSAVRDARNRDALIARARDATGVTLVAIDGAREAALTFHGATPGLALGGRRTVVDVGGGSTEIAIGDGAREPGAPIPTPDARSLDVGSVRLFERHLRSDPPLPEEIAALTADVDAALDRAAIALVSPVVALAGTACTIASIARGGRADVHGERVATAELQSIAARLAGTSLAERRAIPGIPEGRADVIAAGALLLARIAVRAGAGEVIVSSGGVRWGLALEMLEGA